MADEEGREGEPKDKFINAFEERFGEEFYALQSGAECNEEEYGGYTINYKHALIVEGLGVCFKRWERWFFIFPMIGRKRVLFLTWFHLFF